MGFVWQCQRQIKKDVNAGQKSAQSPEIRNAGPSYTNESCAGISVGGAIATPVLNPSFRW
jgi:hypothetical protein